MATNLDHRIARQDHNIRERLVAAAEQEGVQMAEFWVEQNIGQLIAADVDPSEEGESTIASVLAYKNANYVRQLRPGEDASAVTDAHLREAVKVVIAATTSSPAQVGTPDQPGIGGGSETEQF